MQRMPSFTFAAIYSLYQHDGSPISYRRAVVLVIGYNHTVSLASTGFLDSSSAGISDYYSIITHYKHIIETVPIFCRP